MSRRAKPDTAISGFLDFEANEMQKWCASLLIIIFYMLPVGAQSNTPQNCPPAEMTDWEQDGLRGRVKRIRTYKALFTEDKQSGMTVEGERELEEEAAYDAQGKRIKWSNVDYMPVDPKYNLTTGYVCDTNSRIAEVKNTYADGTLARRSTYAYDSRGREIERADYSPDNTLERKETYIYDEQGNLIEKIAKQHVAPQYVIPSRPDVYIVTKVTYKFDGQRNKIEERHFYPDGSLYGTWTYSYDSERRLIKETRRDKEGRLEEQVIYKYNDEGKLIEEIRYVNFCYHQDGRMCDGSINSGDGSFYFATKTTYQYDRQGNWIKQSEFYMDGENNKGVYEPETVLYRKISYY